MLFAFPIGILAFLVAKVKESFKPSPKSLSKKQMALSKVEDTS
jgi:hypothetical protein